MESLLRIPNLARLTVACLLVAGAVLLGATPAAAHTVEGAGPTNYLTKIKSVTPDVDGLDIKVLEFGNRLEATNTTDEELLVLGYHDEPYLRIGSDGVWQNVKSPATFLNNDRQAKTDVPDTVDTEAEPEWQQVSEEPVARWHDHRVHWMGEEPPPAVEKDPGRVVTIYRDWSVPMRLGSTEVAAGGTLQWVPAPSPLPWIALTVLVAGALIAGALTAGWRKALALGALLLVVVSVLQAVGIAMAPGSTGSALTRLFSGGVYIIPAWAAGVFGARALLRGNNDGALGALLCGVILGFVGGIMDIGVLFSSQVAFAAPALVARAAVALCLGLAVGVVVGDIVAFAKHEMKDGTPAPATS